MNLHGYRSLSTLHHLMLREACRRKAKLSQGIWSDDTTEGHAKVLGDSPVDGGVSACKCVQAGWVASWARGSPGELPARGFVFS